MATDVKDWQWFGVPMHFIGARDCRFRLATKVGDVIVSTVGNYCPPGKERHPIGADRTHETMVWKIQGYCESEECGCGFPIAQTDGGELDFDGHDSDKGANAGHFGYVL